MLKLRISHWRCFIQKLFLEVWHNSLENSCVGFSFLIKMQAEYLHPFYRKHAGDCFRKFCRWDKFFKIETRLCSSVHGKPLESFHKKVNFILFHKGFVASSYNSILIHYNYKKILLKVCIIRIMLGIAKPVTNELFSEPYKK